MYQSVKVWVEVEEAITLEMFQAVFEYTKASNTTKGRMDKILQQMVDELNRIQDSKPMYIHYNLDTRARLEHFFAQCYVEVGGSAFKLGENLDYTSAERLRKVFKNNLKAIKKKPIG